MSSGSQLTSSGSYKTQLLRYGTLCTGSLGMSRSPPPAARAGGLGGGVFFGLGFLGGVIVLVGLGVRVLRPGVGFSVPSL